jgi:hypothetical protein
MLLLIIRLHSVGEFCLSGTSQPAGAAGEDAIALDDEFAGFVASPKRQARSRQRCLEGGATVACRPRGPDGLPDRRKVAPLALGGLMRVMGEGLARPVVLGREGKLQRIGDGGAPVAAEAGQDGPVVRPEGEGLPEFEFGEPRDEFMAWPVMGR